jgi:hypothetical protein
MTRLDILIEEIELYKGKQLDKKYIYQELKEIRQELNEQFVITDVSIRKKEVIICPHCNKVGKGFGGCADGRCYEC